MSSRRLFPVAVVATGVMLLVGLLLASWLRGIGDVPAPDVTPIPTAQSPVSGATLLAVGDTASCDNTHDSDVAALAASRPGTIALLGDLAYPAGSDEQFANCFDPVWGGLRDRLRPTPGNHEYGTADASGYFSYLGAGIGEPGAGWYAYDLGSWRVLVLNSNCDAVGGCGPGSPQLEWLQGQLATAPACTLAYWHHPRYSSGRHGDQGFMSNVWSTLAAAHADVVLNGHDHDYERLAADGMREFVVGTGGRSLYAFPGGRSAKTEARTNASYGLLRLTLGSGTYSWEFVPVGDTTFTDAGTGTCTP